ncbi:hypothetical protein FP026_05030 [Rhizobium tropici]|uniref:Uncharacterized protein n=1 Tax=Rhizobium tropici TaxID=398 RepID=A0A5B0WCD6_RHITR|nr:hypothetical protein [Rhizobium tropici]KAA1184734.1 hypothetical protein FP026_05030 [Rhizobium tropici]
MQTPDESDLLKLLRRILRDGIYEVANFADVDRKTTRLLAQALSLRVIREDSAGWNNGARYVLTDDGRRALGLQIDWWMPEDLRRTISPEAEALNIQGGQARPCQPVTAMRSQGNRVVRTVLECTPAICLIAVICGIILVTMVGGRLVSH